ncbi:MAG: hypothetical protein MJZ33_01255 [Paludibacteraceae bacterium]|nr:hypothetical protein [Paludibacteraceae bacterium]
MIYVVNYADGEPYDSLRRVNTKTAYLFGKADHVLEYSSEDIPKSYKEEHKEVFLYKRGAGLWLWKPYIILDALSKVREGDWLFYCDSGATFIREIAYLVRCAEANSTDVLLVEQPLLNRQFCKRECYELMGCEDNFENQLLSGYILVKKSRDSIDFFKEWQCLCEKEELLSPNHFHQEVIEWPDYFSHREDQSILTLLRIKRGLPVFRDPSDYGEMPFMYSGTGDWTYNPQVYPNSDYPTILLCNRKVSPFRYWVVYMIKHLLNKLGLFYTEEKILKKRGVKKYCCR